MGLPKKLESNLEICLKMDPAELEVQLQRARKDQLVQACIYYSILRSGNKPDLVFRLKHHAITKGVTMTEILAVLSGMTGDAKAPPDKSGNFTARIRITHPEPSPVTTPVAPWIHNPAPNQAGTPSPNIIRIQPSTQVAPARPIAPTRRSNLDNRVNCVQDLLNCDVFHPAAVLPNGTNPGLKFITINTCLIDTVRLEISELLDWRRRGFSVWVRGIKTNPISHAWQKCMQLRVNEFLALDVSPPKPLKKRRDDPSEITQFLRNGSNQIRLDVREVYMDAEYSIGFIVCKAQTPTDIVRSIFRENLQSCMHRVKAILQRPLSELEVSDGSQRVDLKCPVSQMRLKIPVRTRACEHIAWFDLEAFVETNKRTPNINHRWKCPKCQKNAKPSELVVDSFAEAILQQAVSDEVEFGRDGNWNACAPRKAAQEPKESYESDELPVERRNSEDVIDLNLDEPPPKRAKSIVISLE